ARPLRSARRDEPAECGGRLDAASRVVVVDRDHLEELEVAGVREERVPGEAGLGLRALGRPRVTGPALFDVQYVPLGGGLTGRRGLCEECGSAQQDAQERVSGSHRNMSSPSDSIATMRAPPSVTTAVTVSRGTPRTRSSSVAGPSGSTPAVTIAESG